MRGVVFVLLCFIIFVACYDVSVKINDVDIPVRKTTEGDYSGTYNFFSGGYAKFECRYTGVKTDLLLLSSNDLTPTSSINITEVLAKTSGAIMKFNATCEPESNEGAHPVHILITFIKKHLIRGSYNDVVLQMHGLSLSRVLAVFEPRAYLNIALYEYHDDDVLHLKCNSYSRYTESVSLLWKYDASRISVKNAGTESNLISGDFELDASQKTGVVSCIVKPNDTSTESLPYTGVILYRK